ncbi:hypothetical protein ZWY2020_007669 [Hordeum vulgare]|nr:hypothetical protein ZWY2020_007669 [Hordeum vulgare]
MKRQRSSYVDDDDPDGDRRRFYDRGGPPSPPPPRRRPAEYESDEFDRRGGFGGRFYDHRYRDSPSPRGYGGDRAMHRSESFSGFRREFPKGFRADRDRSRWDASGSGSAWRRPGGPWRDPHGLDGHKSATRRQAPSPPTPPRRSPSEPRRRIDGPKGDKLRKHNCAAGEIEEGELAPDPDTKAPPPHPPATAEHQKWVDSGRADDKGTSKRCELKKVDSPGPRLRVDVRTQAADNLGKEKGKIRDDAVAEAGKATNTQHEKSALDVTGKFIDSLHKVLPKEATDGNINADGGVGNCISSSILQGAMQEEVKYVDVAADITDAPKEVSSFSMLKAVHEGGTLLTANTVNLLGDSNSSVMLGEAMHETVTTKELTANVLDIAGKSSSSTMLQEDVMTSLCQESQEIKETEIGNVGDKKVDETTESIASQPVEGGLERYGCENRVALDKTEVVEEKEEAVENEIVAKQVKHIDLEANLVGAGVFLQSPKDHIKDTKGKGTTLDLIMEKPRAEDKGKGIAFDVLNKAVGLAVMSVFIGATRIVASDAPLLRRGAGSRAHGTNEMQFHCGAYGHPSEMYGFVKEVFRTCAKQWRWALIRELQYVERIFSASDDVRGRRVRDFVKQMVIKVDNRAYYSEVIKYVLAFFSDDYPNMGSGALVPLLGIPCSIAEGINGIPS